MISVVALLCLVAGSSAIPVPTDYPKYQGYGGLGINGGIIGINNNRFESNLLGFNGGNSAAAAAASAASGLNSAAAAAAANAASGGSHHFGQQGVLGFNNRFDAEFGFNGGNSAAASAAAAASGMNAAAAAAAASSAQGSSFTGFQGHSGHHLIGSNYGPLGQQVPSVQFPAVQQFNGLGGSAAAAAAVAAGQQSAAAAAAAAAGQNAAAAAAAAAGRNAAAAAAASASGPNFGPQIGIGASQFVGQIGGQFVQPASYYLNNQFVAQNSGAAAAAAAAASNNAAAAAAAASVNGFNGGIIGGPAGVIRPQIVRGKKY